jgi:hypothetical protein
MTMTFNPQIVTNATGGFSVETTGYIAGFALDDPHIRNELRGGPLDYSETMVIWGGIPINVLLQPPTPESENALGNKIKRATAVGEILGWSVFNQDHSMINSAQSAVPVADRGMNVNYYLTGTRARICVPCDPAIAGLTGQPLSTPISWDFALGMLVGNASAPLNARLLNVSIGQSMAPIYDPNTQFLNWNRQASVAVIQI